MNWAYEVLSHPPYSLDLLPTNDHFLKYLDNFLQGKHFHNQEEAENAFQEFMEFWSTDFYATWINKILVGKNVLTVMVPILINIKMYLSLTYNDLKFMVWNCNYFCTNLILNILQQVGKSCIKKNWHTQNAKSTSVGKYWKEVPQINKPFTLPPAYYLSAHPFFA